MQKTLAVLLFASFGTGCWMYSQLDDTMTQDGVPVSFHAIMVLKVTDSVNLINDFGPEWYKNKLEEPCKTMVRQALNQ
jgi:hypothetical protein